MNNGNYLPEVIADKQETDPELGSFLSSELSRTQSETGHRFDTVTVHSVDEMGDAMGTCCRREIELREDIVSDIRTARRFFRKALRHEDGHRDGDHSEGFTELFSSLDTNTTPVPAYRVYVEHAKHVADAIGERCARELAKRPEAHVALLQEYFSARARKEQPQDDAAEAAIWDEGEEHIRLAA